MSGQATHFASPEELLAFMARVLTPCLLPVQSTSALPQHPSEVWEHGCGTRKTGYMQGLAVEVWYRRLVRSIV